jgi:hypothetical protein
MKRINNWKKFNENSTNSLSVEIPNNFYDILKVYIRDKNEQDKIIKKYIDKNLENDNDFEKWLINYAGRLSVVTTAADKYKYDDTPSWLMPGYDKTKNGKYQVG